VHVDWLLALAGLFVGFTVGLTGMGGGALMTPILVILFKIQPLAAVSSDLVAAMVMKPVGGAVHLRRGTVNRPLVMWLAIGSVPSAFAGVLILRALADHGVNIDGAVKIALGVALLVASASIVAKAWLQGRIARARQDALEAGTEPVKVEAFAIKPLPTLAIGILGGLVVGMTSVGSGSLIIVMLMVLYPMLSAKELVGTDLVQAIPLVAAAAIGHILFGDFKLGLTASLLLGSLPGVYLGAKYSSRAPDGVIKPVLAFVLLASGLKLVNVGTTQLGFIMLAVLLVAVPVWGAIDAAGRSERHWEAAGQRKRQWVVWQATLAIVGAGFFLAIAYFARIRPKLIESAPGHGPVVPVVPVVPVS
jgi:uncharacterized membrane protein YfcA